MNAEIQKLLFNDLPNTAYARALEIWLKEEREKIMNDMLKLKTLKEIMAKQDTIKIIDKMFAFLNKNSSFGSGSGKEIYK